jgi:tRNA-splicing ligase RtcB
MNEFLLNDTPVKVWAKNVDPHAWKEIEMLDSKGIIHVIRSQNHLDEAASAYKNIDEVMANQQDLVKILTRLSPIAVVKG